MHLGTVLTISLKMRKLATIAIFLSLTSPLSSYAFVAIFRPPPDDPGLTITLNTDTDTTAYFDVVDSNNSNLNSFEISTLDKTGSFTDSSIFSIPILPQSIRITETIPDNFKVNSISCSGDGLIGSSLDGENSIILTVSNLDFSPVIACTFENTKIAQKKTPILIVPGILGTEIKSTQNKIWLDLGRIFLSSDDNFLDLMQFKSDSSPTDNSLAVTDVIKKEEINVGVGNVTFFDYTDGLINEVKAQGYTEGLDLFTFPYDWRYGVTGGDGLNVKALKQKIADILVVTGSDKVDIVAHSTGGLMVKKYVMENPLEHHIDKLVFVGVPNLGAPQAIKVLLQGDNFGVPGLNDDEIRKITQNMPVAYDLMPSQSYFDASGSFLSVRKQDKLGLETNSALNMGGVREYLVNTKGLSGAAYDTAQSMYAASFNNFKPEDHHIDAYNIVGCKTATLGSIIDFEQQYKVTTPEVSLLPSIITGDGTVPSQSADSLSIDVNKRYYAIKTNHGRMLSASGVRQQITNILTGSHLDVGKNVISSGKLKDDTDRCHLSGMWLMMFSPVDITIYDKNGNRLGFATDRSIENSIPGADFEVFGEHKFIYVPTDEGETYDVVLMGTGNGTYTLKVVSIENGTSTSISSFNDLPVTPNLRGKVVLDKNQPTIELDSDDDGIFDKHITPSSVITGGLVDDTIHTVSHKEVTVETVTNPPTGNETEHSVPLSAGNGVPGTVTYMSRSTTTQSSLSGTGEPQETPLVIESASSTPRGEVLGAAVFKFHKNLWYGLRDENISELQKKLLAEGVYKGPITGYFGSLTKAAVITYQRKNAIYSSGFVGELTRESLNK